MPASDTPLVPYLESEAFQLSTAKAGRMYGTLGMTQDGRFFRYSRSAGTAVAAARLAQSAINHTDDAGNAQVKTNYDDVVFATAGVVGDTALALTLNGAGGLGLNELQDGYVVVEDDTGEGIVYVIASHAAAAASAAITININPPGLRLATITATTVALEKNPYDDFLIQASPNTGLLIGVAPTTFTANRNGWLQTGGPCAMLTDGTIVIGEGVVPSDAVDGAVEAADYDVGAALDGVVTCGWVMEVAVDTEMSFCYAKFI